MNYDPDNKTITVHRNTGITLSLGVLVTLVASVISITSAYSRVLAQASEDSSNISTDSQRISKLENDNVDSKTQLSSINARLTSIDANILEIKSRL